MASFFKVLAPKLGQRRLLSNTTTKFQGSFPGTPNAKFTDKLSFVYEDSEKIPVYKTMMEDKKFAPKDDPKLDDETLIKLYRDMTAIRSLDRKLEATQRVGQNSFYMTATGEECITAAASVALDLGDVCYTQYREHGLFYGRGYEMRDMIRQVFALDGSHGEGKQMPVHYGSKKLNLPTVSSPLGVQVSQAVGHAYSFKLAEKPNIVTAWFGDGTSSEGDVFVALNFAAVLETPIIFCCRNNGYAISTPTTQQYRGDGVGARAIGLGIPVIRVNGNDIFACYNAVVKARQTALTENRPIFIEFMTYRVGNHSTSDDSTAYREKDEINKYKSEDLDPITKFETYLRSKGIWDSKKSKDWQIAINKEITKLVEEANKGLKPCPMTLFDDVYSELPKNLKKQKEELLEHLDEYGEHYALEKYNCKF